MHWFKAAILLYQSSLERKIFRENEKDTIALFCHQINKAVCCIKGFVWDEKLREVPVSYFFCAANYTDDIENFPWDTYVYK